MVFTPYCRNAGAAELSKNVLSSVRRSAADPDQSWVSLGVFGCRVFAYTMGVHGLSAYVQQHQGSLGKRIVFQDLASATESKNQSALLVDGNGLLFHLVERIPGSYAGSEPLDTLWCDFDVLESSVLRFVQMFRDASVSLKGWLLDLAFTTLWLHQAYTLQSIVCML